MAASLTSGDLSRMRPATGDRIHQPYRAPLVPGFEATLASEDPELLAVALSGAGPSVPALVSGDGERIGALLHAEFAREGVESDLYRLAVATRGATSF